MTQAIRALLVEDNPNDAELIVRALRAGGFDPAWQRVDTEAEYLRRLDASLDVILCDHAMPQFTGPRALRLLKQRGLEVPFICVSGTMGEDVAVEAMKLGASDYLLKDRLARLGPAVRQAVEQTRLRKEQQWAEQRIGFQSQLLGAVGQAVIATDLDAKVLYLNPFAEELYGWPVAEAYGRSISEIATPEISREQARGIARRLWSGESWSGELQVCDRDGAAFPVEVTASPIHNQQGGLVGFVSVSMNIAERRQLEEQYRQAQKMEVIGHLAGGVAHDFNNILNVIEGYATLLRQGVITGNEAGQEISLAVDRAAGLSRQLLAFSRKNVMQLRTLDVKAVVTDITKMLRPILGGAIELELELAAEPLFIHADRGMIEQVLVNLAVNARDAMPSGGRLTIATTPCTVEAAEAQQNPHATPGSAICLRLTDNGCGMAPEVFRRIFEPFFTTKEVGRGSGLGLATVYGIVRQHRGWIAAESEVDRGTSFRIYFPAVEGPATDQPAPVEDGGMARGSATILLVEDEPALRMIVRDCLERCGYHVVQAISGAAALEAWPEHREKIDLLLTDMVMPDGVSGGELAKKLTAEKPDLKVLYTSGYSPELAGQGLPLQDGINFIQKPYNLQKLTEVVRDCLNRA